MALISSIIFDLTVSLFRSQNAKIAVMGSGQLSQVMAQVSKYVQAASYCLPSSRYFHYRDPTQHHTLKEEIEAQSTALYSTARLWDDGIIKPTDTRDVVGLGLALAARKRREANTTWDGNENGFGIFRM